MILLIIVLPLIGCGAAGVFGRYLGGRGAGLITTGLLFMSFVLFCSFWYLNVVCPVIYLDLGNWIMLGTVLVKFGIQWDSITSIMIFVVLGVSSCVHLYSLEYMKEDPHLCRFMCYLSLFTFFMLVLVVSDNYLELFVGWEGVGLCSYLLIGFWSGRILANRGAIKAMIVNRVGDLGLMIGMFLLLKEYGTLNYDVLSCLVEKDSVVLEVVGLCLFWGAVGKSAQLGLHTWLPDAMEGPTPVSALIHAATMVTAGVFLLIRSGYLFECCNVNLVVLGVGGGVTAIFAGSVGLVQSDLKKVIAYSTCSQLGLMVLACGGLCFSSGLYHLLTHACFKALLFLGAGSVIHAVGGEQDLRKLGGIGAFLPITYLGLLIGSLSLMGFPFLSGFYSKDIIVEGIGGQYIYGGIYWLGLISILFTGGYSIRLLLLAGGGLWRGPSYWGARIKEGSWLTLFPLVCLSLGSIILGFGAIGPLMSGLLLSFATMFEKSLPLIFVVIGGICGWLLGVSHLVVRGVYIFLYEAWHFNLIINTFISKGSIWLGYHLYKFLDCGGFEVLGPEGGKKVFIKLTQINSYIQSGRLYHYLFLMGLAGLIVVIFN